MTWYDLLGIVDTSREDHDRQQRLTPYACPNDGEPLRVGPTGILFCAYDSWTPEGTIVVPLSQGRDWANLQAVVQNDKRYLTQQQARPYLSCPNDGEPLTIDRYGVIFCRFDGWQPPT